MDPMTNYTWGTFVTAVNGMLTVDADRSGTSTFKTAMIRQAVIDLQSSIVAYRQNHETLYYSCDFVLEGYASRAVKPPQSRIVQMFHITNAGSNECCCRRLMDPYPWQDRFALVQGTVDLSYSGPAVGYAGGLNQWQAPGSPGFYTEGYFPNRYSLTNEGKIELNNRPKYTVDPEGYTFYVYPEITGCSLLSMFWNGVKVNFADGEWTPFDEPMAMAVAEYVKAKIAREINHDLDSHNSYMASYANSRSRLYIDANERKH